MRLLLFCGLFFFLGNLGNTVRLPSTEKMLHEQRLDTKISSTDNQISDLKVQIKLENKQLREDISLIFENLIHFEDRIKLLLAEQKNTGGHGVGQLGDSSQEDPSNTDDRFKQIDARMDKFERALSNESGSRDELMDTVKNINIAVSLMSDDIGEIRTNLNLVKQTIGVVEDSMEELKVGQRSVQQSIVESEKSITEVKEMVNTLDQNIGNKTTEIQDTLSSAQRATGVSEGKLNEIQARLKAMALAVGTVHAETMETKDAVVSFEQIVLTFKESLRNYSEEVGQLNEKFYEQITENRNRLEAKLDDDLHALKNLTNLSSQRYKEVKDSTKELLNQSLTHEDLQRSWNLKMENHLINIRSFLNEMWFQTTADVESSSQATTTAETTASTPEGMSTLQVITSTTSLETSSVPEQTAVASKLHHSCRDGITKSGVYKIQLPDFPIFEAYCDMDTDGGGWMVFQRRKDGSVDFYRNWTDYKSGFGNLSGEFWLGNDIIHKLTLVPQELRIDLLDWDYSTRYAKYGNFSIGPESDKYRLQVSGYSGNAGDCITSYLNLNNSRFSTRDQDNDNHGIHCAVRAQAAWWYNFCAYSSLNGYYYPQARFSGDPHRGLQWQYWGDHNRPNHSLKGSEMKVRPK